MGSGEFSDVDSKLEALGASASGSGTPKGKAAPLPRGNAVSLFSAASEDTTDSSPALQCSICRRRKLRCDGVRPKCSYVGA